ncbi:MAG: phosphoribulokinase [Actinomycetota bacterium]|jgi:phosphoribulokinase|nr:phosphoribulokinase [Actinomycetota bacterium]
MPRPIILGIVGDSAAGKTTISGALVDMLGEEQVTHVATDDYHKYDREQRKERDITPLHPECNYMDIIAQHLSLLREGEPILKPVYQHEDGTFGPPEYVAPRPFAVVEGLLGYHTEGLRDSYDVRVYLAPPEELRRKWKVKRDTSSRGYTEDEVLADLDKREPDSAQFIRPQERHADLVIRFVESEGGDPDTLDAQIVLRESLQHPDLSPFLGDGANGITLIEEGPDPYVQIPGDIEHGHAEEIQEAMWEQLHFASHLRSERLGQLSVGSEAKHSDSLALVQLLILYHMVTARAAVAVGGEGARSEDNGAQDKGQEAAAEES